MLSLLTHVCAVVYLGGLLVAAGWDIATYTIPNRVVVILGVSGLVALGLTAGSVHAALHVLGVALVVLMVGALMFFVHLWGAGDAKLLAVVALWVGPKGLPVLVFWTVMVGGLLAFVLLVARRLRFFNKSRLKPWCAGLLSSVQGVPYGVAIAVGGIVAFFSHHNGVSSAFLVH